MSDLHFREINFKSSGPDNKNKPTIKFGYRLGHAEEDVSINIVELSASIQKKSAYELFIAISAQFTFDESEPIDEGLKEILLRQNASAILFPYLRSEISILTTQPNVSPIIIPPLNMATIFEGNDKPETTD